MPGQSVGGSHAVHPDSDPAVPFGGALFEEPSELRGFRGFRIFSVEGVEFMSLGALGVSGDLGVLGTCIGVSRVRI